MLQSVIVSMNFVFFVLVQNVACQRQRIQPESIAPKHFLVIKILCRINTFSESLRVFTEYLEYPDATPLFQILQIFQNLLPETTLVLPFGV